MNVFGQERIQHLLNDIRFMMKCIRGRENGVLDFIARKYFDAKVSSNSTIRKTSEDAPFEILTPAGWSEIDTEVLIDRLSLSVEGDFADFIGVQLLIDRRKVNAMRPLIDGLMSTVGEALDWDLTCPEYESYENVLLPEHRNAVRAELRRLLAERLRALASVRSLR
jgi:hypothetical protein